MGKLFVNSELVESNGYEAHIGDETDARIPWKITGNKIERDGSETRALARACIPEQPDLIDSLTFEFKKRSSLDLRINKLTKLLPSLLVNTMESEPCHDFSLSLSKCSAHEESMGVPLENYSVECILASDDCAPEARVVSRSARAPCTC
ncbi:hypothetical protein V1477_005055 [Vespula maculifrons]|uniref:Uncharacterized protein n=1 Tax=Vespula maculifrons TaxID=7453 RepID=A0ABD2CNL9_VESMC